MYSAHAPTTQRCKSVKPKLLEKFPEKNQRLMVSTQSRAKKEFISDELTRIMSRISRQWSSSVAEKDKTFVCRNEKKISI